MCCIIAITFNLACLPCANQLFLTQLPSPIHPDKVLILLMAPDKIQIDLISDVLGWASSPEPAEPSLFKPKPGRALTRACNGLGPGFRFQKPEPRAQARALIH